MVRAARAILVAGLAMLAGGSPAFAQDRSDVPTCPAAFARVYLQEGAELCARTIREISRGTWEAEGSVTITVKADHARLQADRLVVRDQKSVTAEGSVLAAWSGNRVSGTRMTYDLDSGNGVIENATGRVDPEFYFSADTVKKIGPDRVHLTDATITTCTQPVPYWSFSVSRAKVRLDHYARLTNLRLRVKRVPAFWLPYLVWPVKRDRAAGLLFPTFGTTRDRGEVVTQGLFVPLGQSADLLLFGEYYTRAGWGGGGTIRAIPNRDGNVNLRGFYIQDEVSGFGRYNVTYQQTQRFLNGFRLVADVNQVSDFGFFNDYERELSLVSSPTILARLELTRNGDWTSLNVRELRREQLFADGTSLVQQTLPEVEWRGRSRRLGTTPLYLTYEGSLANVQQSSSRIDADYLRGDLSPTLSAPFSPTPWLDITPSVNVRATHWTQSQQPAASSLDPIVVDDSGLSRFVGGGALELVGPKLFKIFERPSNPFSTRYKHTVEGRVSYVYQQSFDRSDEIIVYDEVDRLIGAIDQVRYGIRSRLFAQRPRSETTVQSAFEEKILVPEGDSGRVREAGTPETAGDENELPPGQQPREPVEIATFELTQSSSFDRPLSFADRDGDGTAETTSRRSGVDASGRFSPSAKVSMDLRARYDVLYNRVSDVSLSGFLRGEAARTSFSLVHRAGLSPGSSDSTQMRLGAGVTLWGGKLRVDFDGAFVPTGGGSTSRIPDQRWRVEYYLQCCGFLAEYFSRDFVTTQRRDFRFTVDLRGIGKLFDFKGGYEN